MNVKKTQVTDVLQCKAATPMERRVIIMLTPNYFWQIILPGIANVELQFFLFETRKHKSWFWHDCYVTITKYKLPADKYLGSWAVTAPATREQCPWKHHLSNKDQKLLKRKCYFGTWCCLCVQSCRIQTNNNSNSKTSPFNHSYRYYFCYYFYYYGWLVAVLLGNAFALHTTIPWGLLLIIPNLDHVT